MTGLVEQLTVNLLHSSAGSGAGRHHPDGSDPRYRIQTLNQASEPAWGLISLTQEASMWWRIHASEVIPEGENQRNSGISQILEPLFLHFLILCSWEASGLH